jgi:hypothetical protein
VNNQLSTLQATARLAGMCLRFHGKPIILRRRIASRQLPAIDAVREMLKTPKPRSVAPKKDHRRLAMVASTALENNQQYDKIHDEINYRTNTTPSKP